MANVIIHSDAAPSSSHRLQRWVSDTVGYIFCWDEFFTDIGYHKTTDGGATWGSHVTLMSGRTAEYAFDIYCPRWDDPSNDNVAHIVWLDQVNSDARHAIFDFDSETLGSEHTILSFATASAYNIRSFISVCRARNGNLVVAGMNFDDATAFTYRSTDSGASWSSRAAIAELASYDRLALWPDYSSADTADVIAVYRDMSANQYSIKQYDDSADSVAETVIGSGEGGSLVLNVATGFRQSDGHILLVHWNARAVTTGDLLCWDIYGSTATAKTNVKDDALDNTAAKMIAVDNNTDDLYVVFSYDPTDTGVGNEEVYYVKSTDGGDTWGAETEIGDGSTGARQGMEVDPSMLPTGGVFQPIRWESTAYVVNAGSGIEVGQAVFAALSETVVPDVSEAELRAGGETLLITLSGATWAAGVPGDNAATYELIRGMDSDGAESKGWDAIIKGLDLPTAVVARSPVVYYRMNEAAGAATAVDSSGNGLDGTYTPGGALGPTLGAQTLKVRDPSTSMDPHVLDNEARLERADDVAIQDIFDGGGGIFCVMHAETDGGSNAGRIVGRGILGGGLTWSLYVADDDGTYCRIVFEIEFSGGFGRWQTDRNVPLNQDRAVLVAFDADSPANDPTIWINRNARTVAAGSLTETATPSGTRVSDVGDELAFGNAPDITAAVDNFLFRGFLSDGALFDTLPDQDWADEFYAAAFEPGGLEHTDLQLVSSTKLRVNFPAFAAFDITSEETITVTVPDDAYVAS